VHTLLVVLVWYCYCSAGGWYTLYCWCWIGTVIVVQGVGTVVVLQGVGTHCIGGAGLVLLLYCRVMVHTVLVVLDWYCYCTAGCWYTLYWWCWFGTVIVVQGVGTHFTGGAGFVLLL
jgi:hypothetical protein